MTTTETEGKPKVEGEFTEPFSRGGKVDGMHRIRMLGTQLPDDDGGEFVVKVLVLHKSEPERYTEEEVYLEVFENAIGICDLGSCETDFFLTIGHQGVGYQQADSDLKACEVFAERLAGDGIIDNEDRYVMATELKYVAERVRREVGCHECMFGEIAGLA